jgi:hypothetical protein
VLITKKKVEKKMKENDKKEEKSVIVLKDERDKVRINIMRKSEKKDSKRLKKNLFEGGTEA